MRVHFFFIVLLIEGFISFLVFVLLRKLLPIFRDNRLSYGYWLLTLSSMAVMPLSRFLSFESWPSWLNSSFVWLLGVIFMLPLLLLWQGVVLLRNQITGKRRYSAYGRRGMTRRDFLKSSAVLAPAVGLGLSSAGVYGASEIKLWHHTLEVPTFPAGLEQLKVAQISDTHIGTFFSLEQLDGILTRLEGEKADLLVITGDLIDDLKFLESTVQRLSQAAKRFPFGVYFCWGNHEYFRDIGRIRSALAASPIVVLENSNRKLTINGSELYLAGVDYPWSKNKAEEEEVCRRFLGSALQGIPQDAMVLLLSHHPDFISHAFQAQIPLTLSGHTHGGQLGLFGKFPLLPLYKYMRGLYEQDGCYSYVSTGTGHWLPFRLGCPAEAAVFTLKKK